MLYLAYSEKQKTITSFNSGLPSYVNASFVVGKRLYIIKSDRIYIIEQDGSVKGEKVNSVFTGYPKIEDILADSWKASKSEESSQKKFFNRTINYIVWGTCINVVIKFEDPHFSHPLFLWGGRGKIRSPHALSAKNSPCM